MSRAGGRECRGVELHSSDAVNIKVGAGPLALPGLKSFAFGLLWQIAHRRPVLKMALPICCKSIADPLRGGCENLLPGIPDHISIQQIAPRLKWKTSQLMQTVSLGWQHAFHSRSVYKARMVSSSTEAFIVVADNAYDGTTKLTLYSCEDSWVYELPQIPDSLYFYSYTCYEAKVHLWTTNGDWWHEYEFDLLGDKKWTQVIPGTQEVPLRSFWPMGDGNLDGKMYRFWRTLH